MADLSLQEQIFTVSELTRFLRQTVEGEFCEVSLTGELSNFARPQSGHWYFSLKDSNAQLRAVMFRGQNRQVEFIPQEGDQVLLTGKLSVYEARGDLQLIAHAMHPAGEGLLQQQFIQLKQKLEKQGLFAAAHKKPLPETIQRLGIITSPTGAAVHDILSTLKRRFPALAVIIYPAQVQGAAAAPQLVQALNIANQRAECDALILSRGGGSLEDLWCFNDEALAHAIFESTLPIITGIGHRVDTTIADFVADVCAPTPTAAAELCSPDRKARRQHLQSHTNQLIAAMRYRLQSLIQQVDLLQRQLQSPSQRLLQYNERCQHLQQLLHKAWQQAMQTRIEQVKQCQQRLSLANPTKQLPRQQQALQQCQHGLQQAWIALLQQKNQTLQQLTSSLNTLSPLATLTRGYTITRDSKTHQVIDSVKQLKTGDQVEILFQDGSAACQVID